MCLAIPGLVVSIEDSDDAIRRHGKVSFGGILKDVSLAYTPEAVVGDYVIVHVGFALQTVDKEEAEQVFSYLKEMGEFDDVEQVTA
jgi:hydrogenase expression/formation protein HypC